MVANVEFKTQALVLIAGEYAEMPVIICGSVDVDSNGVSNPTIEAVYNAITDEEIAMTRVWHKNLATARQELLAVFSNKIDFDYESFCSDAAAQQWHEWRFKAQ